MKKTIRALYEDDALIVFDKRPGLLVIPSVRDPRPTLTDLVNRQYPQNQKRLHPCHRLDRDTSGAIIYAKGKRHQKMMMNLFHGRAVEKTYLAFARGAMRPPAGKIASSVVVQHHTGTTRPRRSSHGRARQGKSALTRYRVLKIHQGFSVVEARPLTGRTNQIRIHFRDRGHPLLGERVYAFGRDFPVKFRRLALHAWRISFCHPVTGRPVRIEAPLPEDMRRFMEKARPAHRRGQDSKKRGRIARK